MPRILLNRRVQIWPQSARLNVKLLLRFALGHEICFCHVRVNINQGHPSHITARSSSGHWLYLSTEQVWSALLEQWGTVCGLYSLKTHALILMSNHFHALVSVPNGTISDAIDTLLTGLRKSIAPITERSYIDSYTHYKCSLISHPHHYLYALKYLYRNPVTAGICRRVEEYPFSTLEAFLGGKESPISLSKSIFESQRLLWASPRAKLNWLNECYSGKPSPGWHKG